MTEFVRGLVRVGWRAYEYIAMVLGLGFLGLLCLLWLPFAMALNAVLPRSVGQPIGRYLIMAGFRTYLLFLRIFCACRFHLGELDALRTQSPMVLVANHPSLLDAVMIVSRFPNMACVMKAALMDNLLLGAAARLARYIPNHAPLDLVIRARKAVRAGAHLLIFPEGTRTRQFPVDSCTASAGLIAQRAQVPVQSLLIEFNTPYLGKAWPLWRRPELPLQCRIRVGRRFASPDDVVAFGRELETYLRGELAQQQTAAELASDGVTPQVSL